MIPIKFLEKLDFSLAIKRVENDIKDDWFRDPIMYKDFLNLDSIKAFIKQHTQNYSPLDTLIFNIPKKNYTLRYSFELEIFDRIIYQALVDKLLPIFDKCLNNRVYAFRYNEEPANEGVMFHSSIESWRRFMKNSENDFRIKQFVLVSDISHFFESIKIDELEKIFLNLLNELKVDNKKDIRDTITYLCKFINDINKTYNGRGIPQQKDPSSFLANIYLHNIDTNMLEKYDGYYRYMDDIRVVCSTLAEAKKALKKYILELRKIGMNINTQKTKIIQFNDEDVYDEIFDQLGYKYLEIDALIKSKKIDNSVLALKKTIEALNSIINKKQFDSREFRFLMHRLNTFLNTKGFETYDLNKYIDIILEGLITSPWNSTIFFKYLANTKLDDKQKDKLIDFFKNDEHNIYEWQSYHLWQLIISQNIFRADLLSLSVTTFLISDSTTDRAGACLYMAKYADVATKEIIAEYFSSCKDFFDQRHALFALYGISEESYKKHVEPHIIQRLNNDFSLQDEFHMNDLFLVEEKIDFKEIYNNLMYEVSL